MDNQPKALEKGQGSGATERRALMGLYLATLEVHPANWALGCLG